MGKPPKDFLPLLVLPKVYFSASTRIDTNSVLEPKNLPIPITDTEELLEVFSTIASNVKSENTPIKINNDPTNWQLSDIRCTFYPAIARVNLEHHANGDMLSCFIKEKAIHTPIKSFLRNQTEEVFWHNLIIRFISEQKIQIEDPVAGVLLQFTATE